MLNKILNYLDNSVSNFHTVNVLEKELIQNKFVELSEFIVWDKLDEGNYFVKRNDSSLIAFTIGDPKNDYSFNIVASHTDFPTFKIKPIATINKSGYSMLNTEPYGGMILSSFFDKPLSIAGRVVIKEDNQIVTKLVNFERPICFIPSLAIHQNRSVNEGVKINPQNDMLPILTLDNEKFDFNKFLSNEINSNEILSYELSLYLCEKAKLVGVDSEFLMSSHLDNSLSVFTSFEAFLKAKNTKQINVFVAYDNEEIGSRTKQGAASTFLSDTLFKISNSLNKTENEHISIIAKSFMISADNAHAVNPNYLNVTDPTNKAYINKGIAIKSHSGFSYTTDAISSAIFIDICKKSGKEYQYFANRSDLPGGGTLGSISSVKVPVNCVDIGIPQFAMHSSYETCGTRDLLDLIDILENFYNSTISFSKDGKITIS